MLTMAGFSKDANTVAASTLDSLTFHFTGNALGPLHLFQAVYPLLEQSQAPGGGVFMPISTIAGSIGDSLNMPNLAYGVSKAALNYICKKAADEHSKIKVLIVQYVFVCSQLYTTVFSEDAS